ncbi:MAG: hypothetical protein ACOC4M_08000 [Promethearchaeia archaeon]
MEEVLNIIKEVQNKQGKEFLGLPTRVEKQLNDLIWFLDQPNLIENPEKLQVLVSLYKKAKSHNFLKMEEIKRKLDQLRVTIGEPTQTHRIGINIKKKIAPSQAAAEIAEAKGEIYIKDYGSALQDLAKEVEHLLDSNEGQSLPEKTYQSLTKLLTYLEDPNLESKPRLFKETLGAYTTAAESDFRKMQGLNDVLNKVEVKLGSKPQKESSRKSLEQRKKEFKIALEKFQQEKKELLEEWKKIERARQEIKQEKEQLNEEKEKFQEEKEKLKEEKMFLEDAKVKLKFERTLLKEEKERQEESTQKSKDPKHLKPPK